MQGKKTYQGELFAYIDIERLIPEDHLLRKIDRVLDLSFIRDQTKSLYCEENGRPSIDPEVFFRAQLLSYLYDIGSDRRLCEEIKLNIAYRWFVRLSLQDAVFEHSSMTRIRDRLTEKTFKALFENVVEQCQRAGLVRARRLLHDASLVDADASLSSMVKREDGNPEARELKYYKARYHDFATGKKQRKFSNQTHVSSSDPDSTIVSRMGRYRQLSYKGHYTADAESRVFTDCHVTSGAYSEVQALKQRIDYQIGRFDFHPDEVIADKAYGSGPNLSYLRSQGIRAYVPVRAPNTDPERIPKSKFTYDRKNDRYICPQKHPMYPYPGLANGMKRYRIINNACENCSLRLQCVPDLNRKKSRYIHRGEHQDEIDRARKRQSTTYFKSKLRERQWKIEGLFGEAKQNHGLRRARYRGRDKVQIQVYGVRPESWTGSRVEFRLIRSSSC